MCGYSHGNDPLHIDSDNDPENPDSDFCIHKRGIIKNTLESNLNQAITSYSRNNATGEYKLPKLTETDWDQVLTNVSIITFIQNIPIGMKYYNNYAIATSTVNKEYVDPDEIYLNASNGDSEYYHTRYCSKLGENDLIGYRSIDYVQKSYTEKNASGNDETKYYYRHSNGDAIDANQACYYCLVQRSLYEENKTDKKEKAYNTALARERYVARMSKLPLPEDFSAELLAVTSVLTESGEYTSFGSAMAYIENIKTGEIFQRKSSVSTKISKEDKEFVVRGDNSSVWNGTTGVKDASTTSLDSRAEVTEEEPVGKSCYTTDDKIKVVINGYDANGIYITYDVEDGNPEYGAGKRNEFNYGTTIAHDIGTGYINVRLHYTTNYTLGRETGLEAWANINENDNLTIVAKTKGIKGKIRLKFTNNSGKVLYSKDIFEVNYGDAIYCEIPSDISWYEQEWRVSVLDTDNGGLGIGGEVKYYTIRDKAGLEGLSKATTNGGAKTVSRIFYLINNISMGDTIINPICKYTSNWFDGYFGSGMYHSADGYVEKGEQYGINNLKIEIDDNSEPAFGLFGWVGNQATIENLKISTTISNPNNVKGKYKVGGLAGFADAGNSINNVKVEKSTIIGSAYVGGCVGESKKQLNNCVISNTTVSSIGTENVIEWKGKKYNTIYVGGIAGLTEEQATINNCQVIENSKIGEGSITIDSNISYNKDRYYVGGMVGYSNTIVSSPTIEANTIVKGGAIKGTLWNENKETYTGGVIGYKNTSQGIGGEFNVKCTVDGHDNVGGIIGFNAGGDINDVSFNGTIKGDGENIGGIVGCNTGGNITNCTNTITINVTGKNVGGIVGCNNKKNITNCKNNALIKGKENVGGIAGITYSTTIKSCNNFGNIEAKEGVGPDYWIMWKIYTGTGGIAGKLYTSTVEQSANSGNIKSTVNVGGIAGLNWCSKVYYSYNKGNVEATSVSGQVGGICGHGSGVDILGCYNIGNIKGKKDLAGIMGSCVNDTKYPDVDLEKYEDKYLYLDFTPGEIHNYFKYCYNAGNVTDTSDSVLGIKVDSSAGILGKRMLGLNDISMSITFVECYFLDNVKQKGYKAPDIDKKDSNVHKMSEEELKRQLYIWASNDAGNGGLFINDNYIYNTITPLETNKGYEGYGVLWWELESYNRTEFYIGSYYSKKEEGKDITKYRAIEDEHFVTIKIGGESVTIDDNNKKHFDDGGVNANLHSWIMLIKDGSYNLEASAKDYGKATQENYNINSTSKNKILALLHTGVENAVLTKSGETTYNWDHYFSENVPHRYRFNFTPVIEGTDLDGEWAKEDYRNEIYKKSTRFGKSTEESSSSNIAQVYLDGLDGTFNRRTGKTYYEWEYYKVGERYWFGTKHFGAWCWKKGSNVYGPYKDKDSVELDSKCTISIPMQSLKNATNELDLSYNPETCKVSKADLSIKFKYWINDNIISKLDFTGSAAKLTEKLGISQVTDHLTYQASFGNVSSEEIKQEINYSLYTTGEFAKDGNMEARLNVLDSNVINSDSNESVNLSLEWDAKWLGIHVAISEVNFEVEYTIATEDEGIFRFYDL